MASSFSPKSVSHGVSKQGKKVAKSVKYTLLMVLQNKKTCDENKYKLAFVEDQARLLLSKNL